MVIDDADDFGFLCQIEVLILPRVNLVEDVLVLFVEEVCEFRKLL